MTRTITVEGMSCEHCENSVVDALEDVEGVTTATADRKSKTATIEGDAPLASLVEAVDEAGYEASA